MLYFVRLYGGWANAIKKGRHFWRPFS